MVYAFDLIQPEMSYMFGFLQTDGHLSKNTRNRGRLAVEIQLPDKSLLEKFQKLISVNSSIKIRTRDTNFKKNYQSVIWTVCDFEFRTALNDLGIPYGQKSKIISPPHVPFSEIDYWRGVIDGDGSLGITARKPFISLVTTSPLLYKEYVDFIFKITGQRKINNPNKRDGAYNICVFCEDAQKLIEELYYPGCLCLDRKFESAESVKSWVRPVDMVKQTWEVRRWTPNEDAIVLKFPYHKAAVTLDRTEQSVKMRVWRLRAVI